MISILNPEHNLLRYMFKKNGEETNLDHEHALQDELYDRFWNKESSWRTKPGSLVTATVYANYYLALTDAAREELARRLEVREATPHDFDSLRRLLAQSDSLHHKIQPDTFLAVGEFSYTDELLLEPLDDPESIFTVAVAKERILGFIQAGIRHRKDTPIMRHPSCLFVYDAVVDERFKKMGIGAKLFAHAFQWGRDRGMRTVELDVSEGNGGAMAFYDRLGFTTVRHRLSMPLE